jgi:DNA-binding CsgD family transcriptional regulator
VQCDVLRLVADGFDTVQIARTLSYSERTVKNIIQKVLIRLKLRNRPHAVAYALRNGLLLTMGCRRYRRWLNRNWNHLVVARKRNVRYRRPDEWRQLLPPLAGADIQNEQIAVPAAKILRHRFQVSIVGLGE